MYNSADQVTVTVSEERIQMLDSLLETIDTDMAVSMSFVRRAQGMSFRELEQKVSGLNGSTLKRYMQQSYPSVRPIHMVAAMSWVMMVPMTSFYYAVKMREYYRGMDDKAIEALYCIGRLPTEQFELYLDMVKNLMEPDARLKFQAYREELNSQVDPAICYDELLPPPVLDINAFAIDYYRSVAITVKRFRQEHNIPIELIARVLGLSDYQYIQLEDVSKTRDFSVAIGFRVKLGFELSSHVNFTSEMKLFPQFHQLRQVQHIRDLLIVEALRPLNPECKKRAVEILTTLSKIYIKNVI
ncbi:hypothetical protein EJ063_08325 [Vibrio aquaticus]|uniref:Uncharacterized protein n=1 Tax=Vibrio aquaticus TaxID=2496559 RepID=A0A432CY06_9VIBR|nr:hypothetical protein [Vibrio aquaticus]RTZ16789.1 hypothetical protein EJ063_08325 [Vibrio aquaticus]